MKRVKRKKTTENNPSFLTKSKKREEGDNDEDSVSIPTDLIIEILTKLPPKSLAKLICVSKLCYSTIRGKYFTDLFLTRSLARPCFLITFHRGYNRVFHSISSFDHNNRICTTLNQDYEISPPIRGLICCHKASKVLICNPSTCQVVDLPKVKTRRTGIRSFLEYDPVNDMYKVLCMTVIRHSYRRGTPVVSEEHQVLTLRAAQKKKWRMIKCQHPHYPLTEGLCRNGVIYYEAWFNSYSQGGSLVVCFDVRLEEFSFVKTPQDVKTRGLVNYHNKIAFVDQSHSGYVNFWVLEDVKKQEWSNIYVVVPSWKDLVGVDYLYCKGTISTGEIIFTPLGNHHPLFVVYYDLKEHNARRVEIEGIGYRFSSDVRVFLDHVENLMFL